MANPLDTSLSEKKEGGEDAAKAQEQKLATKGPLAHLARTPSVMDDSSSKLKTE